MQWIQRCAVVLCMYNGSGSSDVLSCCDACDGSAQYIAIQIQHFLTPCHWCDSESVKEVKGVREACRCGCAVEMAEVPASMSVSW